MQQSSLSSSSASSSRICTSLQSSVSCKSSPKAMGGSAAQRPLITEIIRDKPLQASSCCRSIAPDDGAAAPISRCSIRKSSAASSHGEMDFFLKQCDKYAEAQAADGNGNLDQYMWEGNPNIKTHFKPRPAAPSANPNSVDYPGRDLREEGEGECHGDDVSSSGNLSPPLWENSEDSIRMNWRRLSPAAASCFRKDIEEEQEYFQQVLGSSSHGWTDEKHSSYLDSMEANFLNSVMCKGRNVLAHLAEPSSDLDDSASSHQAKSAAKEFKVCQSGKWKPVLVQASFVNVGPLRQFAVAVKNPWIKRFGVSKRSHIPSLIMEDPLLEEAHACRGLQRLQRHN